MTLVVTFSVDGDPVPKGRPRFARRGQFVQTYTDAKTIDYETQVAMKARQAIGASEPLKGALTVFLYLRYAIPASYTKKRKEACLLGLEYPKKQDIDNVYKSITDAMQGIAPMGRCLTAYASAAATSSKRQGSSGWAASLTRQ